MSNRVTPIDREVVGSSISGRDRHLAMDPASFNAKDIEIEESSPAQQPAPVGFEMHSVPNESPGEIQPPPPGFNPEVTDIPSHPSNEALYDNQTGPTPVEAPYPVDPEPTVSISGVAPIGFEAQVNSVHDGIDNPAYVDNEGNTGNGKVADPGPTDSQSVDENRALLQGTPVKSPEAVVEMESPGNGKQKSIDKTETLFFNDGIRRIDYVLVYKDSNDASKKVKRDVFEGNLEEEGLELEVEDKSESGDGKTYFVKVHAPWEVLCRYAEMMRMKMPMKENDMLDEDEGCCAKCPNPFDVDPEIIKPEPDYFTAAFDRGRMEQFNIKDKNTFFNNAQRSRIVHEILSRTKYEEEKDKFGFRRMISNGSYVACFPLHEGKYSSEHSILTAGPENTRHLLYDQWARAGVWYKYQPLDQIRNYFGEKIGIYFAWLGYYTAMLIPASIVGLAVFIYGVVTMFEDITVNEICSLYKSGNLTMCPLCDGRCSYWRLIDSCRYSKITYLFDNYGTVAFAIFMAVWATMFLEFWKRKQAEIEYDWDVANFEEEEETVRPEFEASVRSKKKNPVTQELEPFLPIWSKCVRYSTAFTVILFMICVVLIAVFGVIVYRIVIVTFFYATNDVLIKENARLATTATAAVINLIVIIILNKFYTVVAHVLTNLEQQRTTTEWEDSFTFKMFLFQFVNFYATLFYIAFFKGRFTGSPQELDNYLFGFRLEECDPAGCLIELCIQLLIVMVGKQFINNAKEIVIPKLCNYCRQRKAKQEEECYTRWEQDYDLAAIPDLGLFEEYLEMVIQYGFVTLFVAAFPLAPLCALINNIIEIRLDAYKFVTQWRRPMAARAQDIGVWWGILDGLSRIAVLTNAFIIAFTSDFVPKQMYILLHSDYEGDQAITGYTNYSLSVFNIKDFQNKSIPDDQQYVQNNFGNLTTCRYRDYRDPVTYLPTLDYWNLLAARLAFVIVFEHAVFFLRWLVQMLIPDVPTDVKIAQLRENYLAKEALYSAELLKSNKSKEDLQQ